MCHLKFFGKEFDLAEFEATLKKYGEERIKKWAALGLEPHFLPAVSMSLHDDYPGWKIKPEERFYCSIAAGKVFRYTGGELKLINELKLEDVAVLIDTRLKPDYSSGGQMWMDDNLLGEIIEKLREEKQIVRYSNGFQSSRFGVSPNEWQEHIRSALAIRLDFEVNRVILEPVIVANLIPQLYIHMSRKKDGKTSTWVWYEEYFESHDRRVNGGRSVYGGLADVHDQPANIHQDDRSIRPLVVL